MSSARPKSALRQEIRTLRRELSGRPRRSKQIEERVLQSPEFLAAQQVHCYLNVHSEVETRSLIRALLAAGKRLCVPYCEGDLLRLVELRSLDELESGAFGIAEPRQALRSDESRHADPAGLDLFILPGVAFDRDGNRLGNGRGFYDRLLGQIGERAWKMALAFECQMVESLDCEPHDIAMDCIITEDARYDRPK